MSKVANTKLDRAFIALMAAAGKPVEAVARQAGQRGPAPKVFRIQSSGQTVRLRTNNQPSVMAKVASGKWNAALPWEGEDYLGVCFPLPGDRPGMVVGFLVPSAIAARDVKERQKRWLAADRSHNRDNKTRVIHFDGDESVDGHGYAGRWVEYRLGEIHIDDLPAPAAGDVRARALAEARRSLAAAFDVSEQAVRISIDY
jgi:hypothetical protein